MKGKKGQGLSLNVIIVAALALIVLVVLIVIFTQQTGQFGEKVGEETRLELTKMRVSYGKCHPGESFESSFVAEFERAESVDNKATAKEDFKTQISRCKEFNENEGVCGSESGCVWD